MQTQVATNKPVLPGGVSIPTTGTKLASEIWVIGLITKHECNAACPYEIQWDTQPHPIVHRKSTSEVDELVANFQHCTRLRLLRGYVGLDLLWVIEPASGSLGDRHLQYGLVRPFDPIMNKYKITFRSGIWSWRSEEEVQEAKLFTESVTTCRHDSWTFAEAQKAAEVTATYIIPESQQAECVPACANMNGVVTSSRSSLNRVPRTPTRTTRPRAVKATIQNTATTLHDKWICHKTKVAIMNGIISCYPELKKNRTGWTEGTLMRNDGNKDAPYNISWNVEPPFSTNVSYETMTQLVRHHSKCMARKLINLFCVGMDLLWLCPETSNPDLLRWVTVMFWDARKIRYKILFRDGSDAWVTGEAIDKAIEANKQYPGAVKAKAALEEWDVDALTTTLITYGIYCAKHVGPASSELTPATATLQKEGVDPPRFPLAPPKQALSYLPGSTVSSAGSSNEDSDIDSFFDTKTHGPPVVGPAAALKNDASTVMVAAAAAMVSFATASSKAGTDAPADATAAPADATAPSSLLTLSAPREDATAVLSNNAKNAVLQAELQKRLAEIKRLTESQKTPVPHYQAGEVMCFMLPKPDGLPTVLVNVYGKLAHDVFAECLFGTCIMQEGHCVTFSYTVLWAAVERMRQEKFSSRCPTVRLNNWYNLKRADQRKLDIEIRESEQRYKSIPCHGQTCTRSSPVPSLETTLPAPEESTQVLINEGAYVCVNKSKT